MMTKQKISDYFIELLNVLEAKTLPEYPDRIFYLYDDKIYIDYDQKTNDMWLNSYKIWSIFETNYSSNHLLIQELTTDISKKYFRLKRIKITTNPFGGSMTYLIEDHLKSKGIPLYKNNNNLENKGIVSDKILQAIDMIIKETPNAVFGGSIALNAVGLLNRKVSDIDLFFHSNESLSKNGFLSIQNDGQILSDTVTNINGKEIQRTGAKINGIKTCCFNVDDEELQHSKVEFLGRKICIQNVNYAIQAKIAYSERNKKHKEDLKIIDEKHSIF